MRTYAPRSGAWGASIQFKIGIALIALPTLILTGFGIYQYFRLQTTKTQYLNHLAQSISWRLAERLAEPMWNFDEDVMEEILRSEMDEQSIYAITVTYTNGMMALGKIRDEQWQVVENEEAVSGEYITQTAEIKNNYDTLGMLTLYITRKFMLKEIREEITQLLIAIVVLDASLLILLSFILRILIVQPINRILNIVYAVAEGDFSQDISIRQNDEIGTLADAFRNMKNIIGNALQNMEHLTQSIQDGKLGARGNAKAFRGKWRELIVGANNVIDAFVIPFNTTAGTIEQISKGDIPQKIAVEYQGDFNRIKNNLNMLIEAFVTSVGSIGMTADYLERIAKGDMPNKITTEYKGDFKQIEHSLNMLIDTMTELLHESNDVITPVKDAFVEPISMTATFLDRGAQGDIPHKITDEYKSDFKQIKQSLNILIDSTNEISRLAEEMAKGNLLVNVVFTWGKQNDEPLTMMSTSEEAATAIRQYRQRFGIEPMFTAQQSQGFDLKRTNVTDPKCLDTLLIVTALTHLFFTNEGYRREEAGMLK